MKTKELENKRDNDILNMLNNISNFEIFTPYEITKNIIDLFPNDVFMHPEYKFLDPCVKSGIFLREIIYKLDIFLPRDIYIDEQGNKYNLANKDERINHILKNMIYGIAISELTGYVSRRTIYGVMDANVSKQDEYIESKIIAKKNDFSERDLIFNDYYDHTIFNDIDRKGYEKEGNIFYPNEETSIENEDTHYPFINKTKHKFINKIKAGKMKFDVIIGNPPYQKMIDYGEKKSSKASALYHIFFDEAIKLNPRYISFIIPSRWMSKPPSGISSQWIQDTLSLNKFKELHDFLNSKSCFPNVDIKGGVNYFLYDSLYNGKCNYHLIDGDGNKSNEMVYLNSFNTGYLIRSIVGLKIVKKIIKIEGDYQTDINKNFYGMVSPNDFFTRKPILTTNWSDFSKEKTNDYNIKIMLNKQNHKCEYGWIKESQIPKNKESICLNKIYMTKAYGGGGNDKNILGKPIISKEKSVCSQTYIVIGYDPIRHNFNEKECDNVAAFIKTKFFRFLVSLKKKTQDSPRSVYQLVPVLDFSKKWTDEKLYKRYNLNKEEIEYIESTINSME